MIDTTTTLPAWAQRKADAYQERAAAEAARDRAEMAALYARQRAESHARAFAAFAQAFAALDIPWNVEHDPLTTSHALPSAPHHWQAVVDGIPFELAHVYPDGRTPQLQIVARRVTEVAPDDVLDEGHRSIIIGTPDALAMALLTYAAWLRGEHPSDDVAF